MEFNNLISCEAGVCKNISHVWKCSYKDHLSDLLEDYGSAKQLKGWCNCRRCPESNTRYRMEEKCCASFDKYFISPGMK